MKSRTYGLFLAAEAVVCAAAVLLQISAGQFYWEAVSFPFVQIGALLRRMSLSGAAGNGAAILIYVMIGLLPLGYLAYRIYTKRAKGEEMLLGILSGLLLWGIYLFINPALFSSLVAMPELAEGGKLMICSCIWAVIAGYAVLRMLGSFAGKRSMERELSWLILLLRCMGLVLVFELCFVSFGSSAEALAELKINNSQAPESQLLATEVVTGLHFLKEAAETALEVWLLFCGERLLWALEADRYSEESQKYAWGLYRVCRITVYANVLLCMGVNLVQLLLGKFLLDADYLVRIPVGRLTLTLAVMVAAKYLAESRRIKQENDLFI